MKSDGFFLKVMRVRFLCIRPIGRQIYVLTVLSVNQTDIQSVYDNEAVSTFIYRPIYWYGQVNYGPIQCITTVCIRGMSCIQKLSHDQEMGQKIIGSIQGHRHSFRRVGNLNGRNRL